MLGSYSYNGYSRTYSGYTDYTYANDPLYYKVKSVFGNNSPKYSSAYLVDKMPAPMESVSKTIADALPILYTQLSKDHPVVIYDGNVKTHASVVIGYRGNGDSLKASDFTVMEIAKSGTSGWQNNKYYASNPVKQSASGDGWRQCYCTLDSWLKYDSGTMTSTIRLSYPTGSRGYKLTISAGTGGVITTGTTGNYAKGKVISLSATPSYGYTFSKWTSSNGGTFSDAKSASCTFTMPATATTVTAEFTANPFMAKANWNTASATKVTQNNAQLNGALRVTKSSFTLASFALPTVSDLYCFASRSQAEVTSATPSSHGGTYFVRYENPTYESDSDGRTYVRSVTSLASLKNDAGATLNLQPGETCYFKWVAVAENAPVTSSVGSFKLLSTTSSWYQLESNTSNGMFSGRMRYSSSQRMVEAGCFVSPDRTRVMNATRGNKNGTALKIDKAASGFEYGTVGSDRFTMVFYKAPPYDTIKAFLPGVTYYFKFYGVTSDGNVTYSGISSYTPPALSTYLFTVAASVGGKVTSGTSGNYAPGNILSLIVTPEEGYVFKGWTTTAGELSDALSSSCSFTMPATAATVTALFAPAEYSVTVLASNGGKVDTSVNGSYTAGSSVNLKATPAAGYRFVGWSSNAGGTFANAEKSTTAFTVPTSNVTIVAEFKEDVSSITFPQGQYQLEPGKTLALTATILPESQKNAVLNWKSSDPSKASVDANGVVTAISEGSITITATAANGVSASCTIKVQLLGDANNDGKVDAADVLIILQHSAGWNVTVNTAKADVTGDGVIGISDALKILQNIMGGDIVQAMRALQRMLADLGLSSLEIALQPTDQYVTAGETATFTVAATGDDLKYQWYIDRNDGSGWQKLNNAVDAAYITSKVEADNDGYQYRCVVTDAQGVEVTTDAAVLHVVLDMPNTGDASTPALWLAMCMLSVISLMILKKRLAIK